MATLKELVNYYLKYCIGMWVEMNRCTDKHLARTTPGFDVSVIKGSHQYCIKNEAIDELLKRLNGSSIGGNCYFYFEDLYDDIRNIVLTHRIKGIGDLTIYDTAKRIGHVLDLPVYPERYVYLARGAKTGAERLLGRKVKYFEPIDVFKPFFGGLPSICIEDFLCIFKDYLRKGGVIAGVTVQGKDIYINGGKQKSPCCCVNGGCEVPDSCYDKNITVFDCLESDCDDGSISDIITTDNNSKS